MPVYANNGDETIVSLLETGGIGILRTDTLYGLVARADNERSVERVYQTKGRTPSKSPILLISSMSQLYDTYDDEIIARLGSLWPGRVSIILPSTEAPDWITRGNGSVAYRIPNSQLLRDLLLQTGPLIAPSANPEGEHPAMDIAEAEAYFGDKVDFYVDEGRVEDDTPSQLYRLDGDNWERLR